MSNIKLLVTILLVLASGSAYAEGGLILTVKVVGAKPSVGNVIVSLFSKENYLKEPIVDRAVAINAVGSAKVQLENMTPGRYAVSVVYDENQDGRLNTGLFGIPIEKVGFSNNVKGRLGPPPFEKAAFNIPDSLELEILLTKAKK